MHSGNLDMFDAPNPSAVFEARLTWTADYSGCSAYIYDDASDDIMSGY